MFADEWIQTMDLSYWNRPLYQLSPNHCPNFDNSYSAKVICKIRFALNIHCSLPIAASSLPRFREPRQFWDALQAVAPFPPAGHRTHLWKTLSISATYFWIPILTMKMTSKTASKKLLKKLGHSNFETFQLFTFI